MQSFNFSSPNMSSNASNMDNKSLPPPHPPVRRLITGHDSSGKSVMVEDKLVESYNFVPQALTKFTGLYRHDEFPANNSDKHDEQGNIIFTDLITTKPSELTSSEGSVFWTVDTPPGTQAVSIFKLAENRRAYESFALAIPSHGVARLWHSSQGFSYTHS